MDMDKKSIADLKSIFNSGEISEPLITQLQKDKRKGVQALLKRYEIQKHREMMQEKNFIEMMRFENGQYKNGCRFIAGVDEAGRGPLAGPVVAAAVILPRNFKLLGLNDSKQLNEHTRNTYFDIIKEQAISYGISIIDSRKIDQINIFEATKLAMHEALNQLDPKPEHILIDAVELTGLPCPVQAITKGDEKSISIAAASILAKVSRDKVMKELHNEYPIYDFKSNMGYGTKHHMETLTSHGISPHHRRSFAPVRNSIS